MHLRVVAPHDGDGGVPGSMPRGKPLPIFVYTGIHFLSDYIDYRGVQLLHNITQITMNTSDYQMITPDYIALHVITCSLHAITFDYM